MPWWNPFSPSGGEQLTDLVASFPTVLDRAVEDWAKFKAGLVAGLFTELQRDDLLKWFTEFGRLWETIEPNFKADEPVHGHARAFVAEVGGFRLSAPAPRALGVVPLVIAGVLIAGAFGIAGAIWAVGYVKKQNNVSNIIDQVTAGTIPANILAEAVRAQRSSIFGDIGGMFKYVIAGTLLVVLWPTINSMLRTRKVARA